MDAKELWNRYCTYYRSYPSVGLSLDISRMRFSSEFLSALKPRLMAAFAAMEELEKGAIANPDEKRMVGHYWLRTPELAPDKATADLIRKTIQSIVSFSADVHSGKIAAPNKTKFTDVVVVGIGGSALGPQLMADALGKLDDPLKLSFCDNTDPDGIARLIGQLGARLAQTLVIVISKSGGTVETRNGALEFAAAYKKAGLDFAPYAIAVTCEGSKLDAQAKKEGWLATFPIWDWVGGRTSLFSAVGLLPAALQGLAVEQFLAGGREMDSLTRRPSAEDNPAALLAAMWYAAGNGRGTKDMVVLPYKDRLMLFSKYLQQLVMESLGKERDLAGVVVNQGLAVYGNKGSTDQHAYVQQLRDGLNNFFATFLQVKEDLTAAQESSPLEVEPGVTSGNYLTGFFLGTRRALFENDRDSMTITLDKLNAHSLGALIALYDRTVGLYASLINVNAYHQPGVEAGKKAASQVIELQHKVVKYLREGVGKGFSADEIASAIGAANESESVFQILDYLSANSYTGVKRLSGVAPAEVRFAVS